MKFCIRIAKLQWVETTFQWCVTFVLPNSYVIKLHLKHIELFSNLSIELASNKKRIRWCRKIKLYHKQSKNKNRYHTHTPLPGAAHADSNRQRQRVVYPSTPVERFGLVACHFVAIKSWFINKQTCLERCFLLPPPLLPRCYCRLLLLLPLLPLLLQHISQRLVRLPQVPTPDCRVQSEESVAPFFLFIGNCRKYRIKFPCQRKVLQTSAQGVRASLSRKFFTCLKFSSTKVQWIFQLAEVNGIRVGNKSEHVFATVLMDFHALSADAFCVFAYTPRGLLLHKRKGLVG